VQRPAQGFGERHLSIKEQLAIAGIDEVTIFPDLDGLGRYLGAVLDSEANVI
jgi:hypothetical protein